MPAPTTTSLAGVELVRAGRWAASTGPVEIRRADLEAIVAAANDPDVDRAPIRIGHVDPRFDGEPALGWVENLRMDGDTLVGDLVEVPAMLAELIPRAFRRRSVEIAWQVRTPAGRQHRAALVGLALLGVAAPAVKGLADVGRLYGRTAASSVIGDTLDDTTAHRVDAVTLEDSGEPEDRVAIRTALAAIGDTVAAMLTELDGDPDPTITTTDAGIGHNDNAGTDRGDTDTMPISEDSIRERLGIEADADLEAELDRIRAEIEASNGDAGDGDTGGDDTGTTGTDDGEDTGTGEDTGAGAEPELVTMSAATLEELRRQAREGAEARRILAAQERERIVTSALSAGRIAPADRAAWEQRLEHDLEGTRTLLSTLTPAFPTNELGTDGSDPAAIDEAAFAEFEAATFGITSEEQ